MGTFEVYIALRASTATAQVEKIATFLGNRHSNIVIIGTAKGYWGEIPQETLIVHITASEEAVIETVDAIARELHHECVALIEVNESLHL